MSHEKTTEDVRTYVETIARRFGWKLNDRVEMLDGLISGLTQNYSRLGYYNCPCRDSQEDRKLDSDIICPCVYAREADVDEYGHCYCALFFRKDVDMSGEITMIPERRPLNRD
jgi:ferredoxin-thioredoxin reductase catalytic chain